MAQNDIIVPREGAGGVLTEIVLPDATTSARGLLSASDKTKLDGIAAGAEVNVNADWNASSGDAQILNKPTLGTAAAASTSDFAAASHTHPASAISDSTTAGRALLTAADASAQRTSLGLGSAATANLDALSDSAFRIADNGDATKKLAFELSGISTGTVRTLTVPDASGTIALTNGATNLWIPASAWIPKTTAGCGVDSRETTTNDQNFDELLFDAGSDEFADALVVMPSNYNNGTVTARFYWTASSGSGGVAFAIQGRAFANDDALDIAAGTAQLVTDTLIAANDMHVTSATSAVTIGGTPAANTPIQFTIYRDVSDAADDLAVDARLLGVEIIYTAA